MDTETMKAVVVVCGVVVLAAFAFWNQWCAFREWRRAIRAEACTDVLLHAMDAKGTWQEMPEQNELGAWLNERMEKVREGMQE